MKTKIKAIWDNEGWFFRINNHEGIAPGQSSLTDPDMSSEDIEREAIKYAEWCSIDTTNLEVEILS